MTTSRSCAGCTACCFLLEVPDVPKPCFQACPHQQDGVGCTIYDKRPEPCADYGCLWIQAQAPGFTDAPADRPNELGVAFFLFAKSPVPNRPCVYAYELWDGAILQPRVVELVSELGKLRPVALIKHGTHDTVIRYPDDMRKANMTGTVMLDRD